MAQKRSKTFTKVELELMQIIWEKGEATPDNIRNALPEKRRAISIGSIRNMPKKSCSQPATLPG